MRKPRESKKEKTGPKVVPPPSVAAQDVRPVHVPSASPALPILTKPNTGKSKATIKLEMKGCDCPNAAKNEHIDPDATPDGAMPCRAMVIDNLVETARRADSLATTLKVDKAELVAAVSAFRRQKELEGVFAKTVILQGLRHTADVTFKDSYSKVDPAHEDALRAAVGEKFDEMFTKVRTVVLRNPQDAEAALRKVLGVQFDALCEVQVHITPKPDFMANRAKLRGKIPPESDAALDAIADQIQSAGSFNHKRALTNGNG